MLLTNHTLTGVALGLSIENPIVLAPVALASHLALDATPHFGPPSSYKFGFRARWYLVAAAIDLVASIAIAGICMAMWPHKILHIGVGVVFAALPDFLYVPAILEGQKHMEKLHPIYKRVLHFTIAIQWYERPLGLITEVVWAGLMVTLLNSMLN